MDPSKVIVFEVSKRPILWDGKDKHMYSRPLAEKEWKFVADKVGLTVDTVKAKWKNLRDTFRRELKKIPSDISKWDTKWHHFAGMHFLLDQMVDKASAEAIKTALQEKSLLKQDQGNCSYGEEDDDEEGEEGEIRPPPIVNDNICDDFDSDDSIGEIIPKQKTVKRTAQKRTNAKRDIIQELSTAEVEPKRNKVYENFDEDEDMIFFKSLLPFMRELTTLQKLEVRNEFQSILVREISNLSSTSVKNDSKQVSNSNSKKSHQSNAGYSNQQQYNNMYDAS